MLAPPTACVHTGMPPLRAKQCFTGQHYFREAKPRPDPFCLCQHCLMGPALLDGAEACFGAPSELRQAPGCQHYFTGPPLAYRGQHCLTGQMLFHGPTLPYQPTLLLRSRTISRARTIWSPSRSASFGHHYVALFGAPSELRHSSKMMSRSANDTGSMYFRHLAVTQKDSVDTGAVLLAQEQCRGQKNGASTKQCPVYFRRVSVTGDVGTKAFVGTNQCWHKPVLAQKQCWHKAVLAKGSAGAK